MHLVLEGWESQPLSRAREFLLQYRFLLHQPLTSVLWTTQLLVNTRSLVNTRDRLTAIVAASITRGVL